MKPAIALPLLLLTISIGAAAQSFGNGQYSPLAQSMAEMMNAMGQAFSQYQAQSGANQPGGWYPQGPGYMNPMQTPSPMGQWMPNLANPLPAFGFTDARLNGSWEGQQGELLIISGGRFRLYTNIDDFRDGELQVNGSNLVMRDPSTLNERNYEYAVHDGRLALRDSEGNLMLFRKVSEQQQFAPQY